jgi:hypothetical protein
LTEKTAHARVGGDRTPGHLVSGQGKRTGQKQDKDAEQEAAAFATGHAHLLFSKQSIKKICNIQATPTKATKMSAAYEKVQYCLKHSGVGINVITAVICIRPFPAFGRIYSKPPVFDLVITIQEYLDRRAVGL